MAPCTASEVTTARREARDARACARDLRARIAEGRSAEEMLAVVDELEGALHRVLVEHEGMSRELLSLYEQIGVVFEVSARLSTVRGEAQVVELFLDSLSRTYQRCTTWIAERRPVGGWRVRGRGDEVPAWLSERLEHAAAGQRVLVEPVGTEGAVAGFEEVMMGPIFAGQAFVCAMVLLRSAGSGGRGFAASDMGLLQSLTTFCGDLLRKKRLVGELHTMSVSMVRALVNAVDQKDEYTSGHSLRVAYFAGMIGRALKLSGKELRMLQWSALLHDVGKIGIRDDVLKKAGKLTNEEFAHMKEHPVRSHRVVQQVPQLAGALPGVLHHHERYDGRGYPDGLAGEAIPLQARILQIADVFDALTSNRSYRAAFTWTRALEILAEEAGKTVDPDLQRLFDGMMRARLEGGGEEAWEQLVAEANQWIADAALDGAEAGDE